MGRRKSSQSPLWIAHHELAHGPGHRFYETRNALLREAAFDRHAETLCAPYCEAVQIPGQKSVAPGVSFRMHLVGFFEGIESERGLEWRFADSLSLRQFLGLPLPQRVPDHSTLSRTRQRLPLAVHQAVFALILGILETKGCSKAATGPVGPVPWASGITAGGASRRNAPSPMSARRVGRAGLGCAAGRTRRSATCCRRPGRISPS
jgi:transposase